ncbi:MULTISPECIES: EF-hand domain-containing protein [unclassified Sphingomonas]|uniref:EF-hand domain-containing protein n=1 Tax=unclassified Sphingomonas TaxID=196159 RepID=UPI00226A8381|nr:MULTISPECIES: EF-hand domain-containing protein [unclassified Sphingomonas]
MWRYVVGAGAVVAGIAALVMIFGGKTETRRLLPFAAAGAAASRGTAQAAALPDTAPEATPETREEKRFNRYDKDRDGKVTRDEYLASRRKAYARLDTDGDGRLSFDEWAAKATAKFNAADGDKSGGMDATEFATTAVKRKTPVRVKCPPADPAADQES